MHAKNLSLYVNYVTKDIIIWMNEKYAGMAKH